jgi:hypothetical protein
LLFQLSHQLLSSTVEGSLGIKMRLSRRSGQISQLLRDHGRIITCRMSAYIDPLYWTQDARLHLPSHGQEVTVDLYGDVSQELLESCDLPFLQQRSEPLPQALHSAKQTLVCDLHLEVVQQLEQVDCNFSASSCKPFQSFLVGVIPSGLGGRLRRCEAGLEIAQGCCQLREVTILLRGAICALVDVVGSMYDFGAKVHKLAGSSRETQSTYRVDRGAGSAPAVSGSMSQRRQSSDGRWPDR